MKKILSITEKEINNSKRNACSKPCALCAITRAVGRLKHRPTRAVAVDNTLSSVEVGRQSYRSSGKLQHMKSSRKKPFSIEIDEKAGVVRLVKTTPLLATAA